MSTVRADDGLYVAVKAGNRRPWKLAPKFAILAVNVYPLCAKCGHTYIQHWRINACGACLCDGYAGRTL